MLKDRGCVIDTDGFNPRINPSHEGIGAESTFQMGEQVGQVPCALDEKSVKSKGLVIY